MVSLKSSAKKELDRMAAVFDALKIKDERGRDFAQFARTYFEDGKYFFNKRKYLEAFEAAVIAWAYIDFGLKLRWFELPKEQRKWFTA